MARAYHRRERFRPEGVATSKGEEEGAEKERSEDWRRAEVRGGEL